MQPVIDKKSPAVPFSDVSLVINDYSRISLLAGGRNGHLLTPGEDGAHLWLDSATPSLHFNIDTASIVEQETNTTKKQISTTTHGLNAGYHLDPSDKADECLPGKSCYNLYITLKKFRINSHNEGGGDEPYTLPLFGLIEGTLMWDANGAVSRHVIEQNAFRTLAVDKTQDNLGAFQDRQSEKWVWYSSWDPQDAGPGWEVQPNQIQFGHREDIDVPEVARRFYFQRKVHPIDGFRFSSLEGVLLGGLFLEKGDLLDLLEEGRGRVNRQYEAAAREFHRNINAGVEQPFSNVAIELTPALTEDALIGLPGCLDEVDPMLACLSFIGSGLSNLARDVMLSTDDDVLHAYSHPWKNLIPFRDMLRKPKGLDILVTHSGKTNLKDYQGSYEAVYNFRLELVKQAERPPERLCQEFPRWMPSWAPTGHTTISLRSELAVKQDDGQYRQAYVRGGVTRGLHNNRVAAWSDSAPVQGEAWEKFEVYVIDDRNLHPIVALSPTAGRNNNLWRWLVNVGDEVMTPAEVCSTRENQLTNMLFELVELDHHTIALRSLETGRYLIVRSDAGLYDGVEHLGGGAPEALRFDINSHPGL